MDGGVCVGFEYVLGRNWRIGICACRYCVLIESA